MAHNSRRSFGRRQSCLRAVARIPGRPPEHCIVRNISEGGALLDFGYGLQPSFNFDLEIGPHQVVVGCEIRHQGQYGVGVKFIAGDVTPVLEALNMPVTPKEERLEITPVEAQPQRAFDALAFRRSRQRAA